jgi:Mor family transcriptional regulator
MDSIQGHIENGGMEEQKRPSGAKHAAEKLEIFGGVAFYASLRG